MQLPRCQHKSVIDNSQESTNPMEPHSFIRIGHEDWNITEAQVYGYDGVFKEVMNKSLKEIYEKTNKDRKEMDKTVQDWKAEIKSTKET